MLEQIKELIQKFDSLEKEIDLVQNNVNFSLCLTWTILGVVVAIIGVAVYFLTRIWVNKRVKDELPKAIESNPPILYFNGILKKISSNKDENEYWYTKAKIELDCEKFKLRTLNFPVELNLYYLESRDFKKFKMVENNVFKDVWTKNTYKIDIIQYYAEIINNVIEVNYIEHLNRSLTDTVFYTLKIPNPIYKNNTK